MLMYQITVSEARKIGLSLVGFPRFWPKRRKKGKILRKKAKGEGKRGKRLDGERDYFYSVADFSTVLPKKGLLLMQRPVRALFRRPLHSRSRNRPHRP